VTPRGWGLCALIGIATGAAALELPERQTLGPQRGDLFSAPPAAPRPALPPKEPEPQEAAPAPPPNPYRFAGTVEHDGKRRVFLSDGARLFEAKAGDPLEHGFKVQSVTADAVTLVYEPLKMQVTIALVFPEPQAAAGAGAPPVQSGDRAISRPAHGRAD